MNEDLYDFTEDTKETEKAIRGVAAAMKKLNKQLIIIRKQYPNANYYMACSTLNLLHRDAHDDNGNPVQDDNIIISDLIHHSDCGDW